MLKPEQRACNNKMERKNKPTNKYEQTCHNLM